MMYSLEIGTTYDVTLRAQAILGASMKNATVQAILDYASAVSLADVDGIHASVLPELPANTPEDASKLLYVKFKVGDNQPRVIAMNWIAAQPTPLSASSQTVVIANCPPSRLAALSNALRSNGFSEFTFQ